MRAVIVEHLGESGTLHEVPVPQPSDHEVLVRITAVGVNPIDWKTRDFGLRNMPFVLGQDFAGIVVSLGPHVSRYAVGERIFGIARKHGAYAQYTVVPEQSTEEPTCKIPDSVGDATAAALPTAGITALAGIEKLGVTDDTTIVIVGASGGVGSFASQIAHERGARTVGIAHSRNEHLVKPLGLDAFIAYDRTDPIAAIREHYAAGVGAVFDLVSDGDGIKRYAGVLQAGGTIVSTIGAADPSWFAQRQITAINLMMNETPQSSHEGLRELVRMVEMGTLKVIISAERGLTEAPQALEASKSGSVTGKMILTV